MTTSRSEVDALQRTAPLDDPRTACAALGLGLEPRDRERQAGGITVRCPVHGGLSCSVTRGPDRTVRVRCFGCDFTGDIFSLVAAVRGLDIKRAFPRVLDECRQLAGQAPPAPTPRHADETAHTVTDETYDRIASTFLELLSPFREVSPRVLAYVEAREVPADFEAFGGRGLPEDDREIVAALLALFERADLENAAILRPGHDAIDFAEGWPVVIPWRSRFGRIDFLQRRRLDAAKPKYRTPRGRSPKSPFGSDLLAVALESLGPSGEIVITEGAFDCLARRRVARHRGERCAVIGVYSSSSPCVGLPLELLADRTVVLALDVDDAGDRACVKLAEALAGVAAEIVRERPDGVKDWGASIT